MFGSQPEVSRKSAGSQTEVSRKSAGSQPEASRKSAGSQPEVSRKSAGSQPDFFFIKIVIGAVSSLVPPDRYWIGTGLVLDCGTGLVLAKYSIVVQCRNMIHEWHTYGTLSVIPWYLAVHASAPYRIAMVFVAR